MKIILNQDVPNLGAPGDVVEVKDGYGRNFLLPRGYAQRWTKGADKQIATIRRAREVREVRDLGHANEIKAQLAGLTVKLKARSGDGGRLFGSVTTADIVTAVTEAGGPKLDRRLITVPTPIKAIGTHQVTVKVHPEVDADLSIDVTKA